MKALLILNFVLLLVSCSGDIDSKQLSNVDININGVGGDKNSRIPVKDQIVKDKNEIFPDDIRQGTDPAYTTGMYLTFVCSFSKNENNIINCNVSGISRMSSDFRTLIQGELKVYSIDDDSNQVEINISNINFDEFNTFKIILDNNPPVKLEATSISFDGSVYPVDDKCRKGIDHCS